MEFGWPLIEDRPTGVDAARRIAVLKVAVLITGCLWLTTGCSALRQSNEAVIRVESKQDTARAVRATYSGIRALNAQNIELACQTFSRSGRGGWCLRPGTQQSGVDAL